MNCSQHRAEGLKRQYIRLPFFFALHKDASMYTTLAPSSEPKRRVAMACSTHKSLLAVVLTHTSVAGFSAQRFGSLRPRAALHTLQQPRTVVAAGAIDLAANATKGLVEGVVRTVTDNEEYQFGKPRHRRHDSQVPLAQAI